MTDLGWMSDRETQVVLAALRAYSVQPVDDASDHLLVMRRLRALLITIHSTDGQPKVSIEVALKLVAHLGQQVSVASAMLCGAHDGWRLGVKSLHAAVTGTIKYEGSLRGRMRVDKATVCCFTQLRQFFVTLALHINLDLFVVDGADGTCAEEID